MVGVVVDYDAAMLPFLPEVEFKPSFRAHERCYGRAQVVGGNVAGEQCGCRGCDRVLYVDFHRYAELYILYFPFGKYIARHDEVIDDGAVAAAYVGGVEVALIA